VLRVYNIQREQFLPSAHALILTFVVVILTLVLFTNFDGHLESLVTVGFLSFFFLSLLRLLEIIDKPFKVGAERTDDDVSLFLLNEFVVQAQAAAEGVTVVEEIEAQAEEVEDQLVEIEESTDDATDLTERATSRLAPEK
jgi:hypothetical protein